MKSVTVPRINPERLWADLMALGEVGKMGRLGNPATGQFGDGAGRKSDVPR